MSVFRTRHLYAPRLSRLTALNTTQALQALGEGMSAIFVPLFLYRLGYDLSFILIYLLTYSVIWLLALIPATWLTCRLGPRAALVIGLVAGAGQFLILTALSTNPSLIWPVAVLGGLVAAFYWLPFRIAFSRALSHQAAGRNVGFTEALLVLASGLAPAIGGLIATFLGITVLYVLTTALFLLAAVPLFFYRQPDRPVFSWADLRRPPNGSHRLINSLITIEDAASSTLWPLLIFLLLPSYAGVGLLVSVVLLAAIAASLYAGYHPRGRAPRHNTVLGAGVTVVGNLLRPLVQGGAHIFGVNVVSGFGKALAMTPYMVKYYGFIEQRGFSYAVSMQLAAATGCVVLFGLLFVVSLYVAAQTALIISLIVTGPFILATTRLR